MKMNILHISRIVAFIGMMFWAMPQTNAQHVTVDAKIDSLQLLIGEQAKVNLQYSKLRLQYRKAMPYLRRMRAE